MNEYISGDELSQNLSYLFDWNRAFLMSGLGVSDAPISSEEMQKLRKCCSVLSDGMPEMFSFNTEAPDIELIEQVVLFLELMEDNNWHTKAKNLRTIPIKRMIQRFFFSSNAYKYH